MSRKTHAPDTRRTGPTDPLANLCYCGGGQAHPWKPDGTGNRILACPSHAPVLAPIGRRRR